ncbi:hypothetical protein M9H77_21288 [Catharanthus roseus]|uniref:Uncharacterized protein n=1 Tax=Catharanthus roseus TaxID=4058 RepID=A0ACC0ANM6_CATRO|nr:hypothetical protein M9H77_21288 [Catharanthus roseus]
MDKGIHAIEKNNTWELNDFNKIKYKPNGEVEHFKARLVAKSVPTDEDIANFYLLEIVILLNYEEASQDTHWIVILLNYEEASQDTHWVSEMDKGIHAIEKNNTWELNDFNKIKYKPNGEVEHFKARLVAKSVPTDEDIANFYLLEIVILLNYEEASQDTHWVKEMDKGIHAIEKNNTWELNEFNKIKYKPNGEVEHFKARLIAKSVPSDEDIANFSLLQIVILLNYEEASQDTHWVKEMDKGIHAIEMNNTWELNEFNKIKYKPNGEVEHFKATLVAKSVPTDEDIANFSLLQIVILLNYEEASQDTHWVSEMDKGIYAIEKNNTRELNEFNKIKYKPNGEVEHFKARLVAKSVPLDEDITNFSLLQIVILLNYEEASQDTHWVKEMDMGIHAIEKNNTWELNEFNKIKYKPNGEVEHFKARLVAKRVPSDKDIANFSLLQIVILLNYEEASQDTHWIVILLNYEEASQDTHWVKEMDKGIHAIEMNNTWELNEFNKIKYKPNGEVEHFKATLVAKSVPTDEDIANFSLLQIVILLNYEEASQDTHWVSEMDKGIHAIEKNNTWELNDFNKIKYKPNGEVEHFKARLVAKSVPSDKDIANFSLLQIVILLNYEEASQDTHWIVILLNYEEASQDTHWVKEMDKGIHAIEMNNTWELNEFNKIKYKPNGEVEHFKATLVAKRL